MSYGEIAGPKQVSRDTTAGAGAHWSLMRSHSNETHSVLCAQPFPPLFVATAHWSHSENWLPLDSSALLFVAQPMLLQCSLRAAIDVTWLSAA